MDYPSTVLRRSAAGLVLAVNLLALGACSNTTNGSMTPMVLQRTGGASRANTSRYITVDNSCSNTGPCANEVAGINDNDDIVGNTSNCSSKTTNPCNVAHWSCNPSTSGACDPCPLFGGANSWQSYTSEYISGGYSSFSSVQFPDAPNGQYMNAISNRMAVIGGPIRPGTTPNTAETGCINTFAGASGEENGVWGLIGNNGLWSVHDKGGASGCDNKPLFDGTGELLGYDNTNTRTKTMVGFYNDPNKSCYFIAAEVQAGSSGDTNWQKLTVNFPSSISPANVVATGITESTATSGSGDIVGIVTLKNGTNPVQRGWYIPNGTSSTAKPYFYPGSTATAFAGIAKVAGSIEIVGSYTLPANGTKPATTHGLVATPTTSGFTLTTIDEPNASGLTVINGINANGDICGWFTDTNGTYHGFVGLGVVAAARNRHHHHAAVKHTLGL